MLIIMKQEKEILKKLIKNLQVSKVISFADAKKELEENPSEPKSKRKPGGGKGQAPGS